jgi:hypothetical protein
MLLRNIIQQAVARRLNMSQNEEGTSKNPKNMLQNSQIISQNEEKG